MQMHAQQQIMFMDIKKLLQKQKRNTNKMKQIEESIIVVSGCGRCGSSLTMQMLYSGGLPVIADNYASFEDSRTEPLIIHSDTSWLKPGHAVKILDLHRKALPRFKRYKIIYLVRDTTEQAKSQVKMAKEAGYIIEGSQPHKKIRMAIELENAQAIIKYKDHFPFYILNFEKIIYNPTQAAFEINHFLGLELDIDQMAEQVINRPVKCMPDMQIERNRILSLQKDKS